jgi:hypothetical protein
VRLLLYRIDVLRRLANKSGLHRSEAHFCHRYHNVDKTVIGTISCATHIHSQFFSFFLFLYVLSRSLGHFMPDIISVYSRIEWPRLSG